MAQITVYDTSKIEKTRKEHIFLETAHINSY